MLNLLFTLTAWCAHAELALGGEHADSDAAVLAKNSDDAVPDEVVAWLRDRARPLAPRAPESSAAPEPRAAGASLPSEFAAAFESARFAVLEERVSGAREIAELRADCTRALFEAGFGVLVLDGSAAACMDIDRYVHGEPGDAARLLEALRRPELAGEATMALVEELRRRNRVEGARAIHVVGLDVLDTRASCEFLQTYVARIEPDQTNRLSSVLTPLRQIDARGRARYTSASAAQRGAIRVGLEEQIMMLIDQRDVYVRRAGVAQWDLAIEHLTLLSEAEEVLRSEPDSGAADRRALSRLATLARQAERFRDARIVVWTLGNELEHEDRRAPLAEHLRRRFAKECVVATVCFERGAVRTTLATKDANAPRAFECESPPRASLEQVLAIAASKSSARGELDRAWFDLRGAPEGPVRAWLEGTVRARTVTRADGAATVGFAEVVPARAFDLALFVRRVTPRD